MDKVDRYRKRWKKCAYCQWLRSRCVGIGAHSYWVCKAKVKIIDHYDIWRPWCTCFVPEKRGE